MDDRTLHRHRAHHTGGSAVGRYAGKEKVCSLGIQHALRKPSRAARRLLPYADGVTDCSAIDAELSELYQGMDVVAELTRKYIGHNSQSAQS